MTDCNSLAVATVSRPHGYAKLSVSSLDSFWDATLTVCMRYPLMAPRLRAVFYTHCKGLAGCMVFVGLVFSSGEQGQSSMEVP